MLENNLSTENFSNLIVARSHGHGNTWTLASRLGQMLTDAESQFGDRDKTYTILGIEFAGTSPQCWYPNNCKHIIIQLSLNALNGVARACSDLAHETVHLISPTGGRDANCLEEGLATVFSTDYVAQQFSAHFPTGMACYDEAAAAVRLLLAGRPNIIKILRQSEPTISKISTEHLLPAYPDLDLSLVEYLCSPFVRK